MKVKLYTKSNDIELLKMTGENQFTSEEHALVTERELKDILISYDSAMKWWFEKNPNFLAALEFLIKISKNSGLKKYISFGSAIGVIEHLFSYALPKDSSVVATDFDPFFVSISKKFFPNIQQTICFDMINDDVSKLFSETGKCDCAIFFSSAYVLDDDELVDFFSQLRKNGIKRIVDFHGGVLLGKEFIRQKIIQLPGIKKLKYSSFARKLAGLPPKLKHDTYLGKPHGFGRSKNALRKLYHQAGFKIKSENRAGFYDFIVVLEP